jgi:alcohol dehydrogenase (cytochrome c)/quinohemoprotein ethanol dehydrogenase
MAWNWVRASGFATLAVLAACGGGQDSEPKGAVTAAKIVGAANDTSSWLTYGRTYDEQRYSPANQVNQQNVAKLGLAWFADMDTARGQEATPLVIDGKIYVTTAWSKVKAYDGVTGKPLWDYDPQVPGETGVKACCDVVNRGLAAWGDSLFVGTLDGRLVSIDRLTGKQQWSVVTVDQGKPYTITGAPIVIGGMVIIGNGGAEMGVRGYVTAYSATDGKQLWRFYTVPGAPGEDKVEPEYLKNARGTWNGEWWKQGGGGTVWDAMAYDPELDLLYIGVGNGSPWNPNYRSPGGGDNLYLSSIVAIHAKTGEYAWHYQTTPEDAWDFTATQHIMLADLTIGGKVRKVLMQAPKNGFFYVIDRATGEFLSGDKFVPANWATGIDAKGRPIENPEARYYKTGKPFVGSPGATGAHSWHPMAFHPGAGLVLIPANLAAFPYVPEANWKPGKQGFNVGVDMAAASMPADPAARAGAAAATKGALIAWDPVAKKERWRVTFDGPNNGGVLATGGGLAFQGNAAGKFVAYSVENGGKLWSFDAQTGVVAAPITYTIGGEQYVAVLAGWGGVWALAPGILSNVSGPVRNISRLLVFKLGGTAKLPPPPPVSQLPLDPPNETATPAQIAEGGHFYGRYCGACHGDSGIGGTIIPDLRHSSVLASADNWQKIVHDGALRENGMVAWGGEMTPTQIDNIRHYVIARAHQDKKIGPK